MSDTCTAERRLCGHVSGCCGATDKRNGYAYFCTREPHETGEHVACVPLASSPELHNLHTWPNERDSDIGAVTLDSATVRKLREAHRLTGEVLAALDAAEGKR